MRNELMQVLSALGTFFIYAVLAVFAQNAIFTRALGVSRLVKLVDDEGVDSVTFGILLCVIELIASPMAYFANSIWLSKVDYRGYIRPLIYVLCMGVAFLIVLFFVAVVFKGKGRDSLAILPMATFNCCVLGVLLITTTQSFTLLQTMGFALGSGVGYIIAVLVVTEGQRKIQNENVPAAFKGLPVTLLYISVLALAIYGFTGHMQSF
ncbi:MAG: NADH:ubiquinone oxidoreductase, subunit RnfA [Clostridia bacterium]|jgi:Na+-translocating ferredoxin:NAD+ oxidoreductase RnfA subunit|nr:NADH:ubiquinone oxidoreductase, subunit RnfA [Clostridia bacterium]NLS85002.1 NADH:ubiquinone oxidoreductase, subunit RnfA [Oscillospiraceae bacterium]